MYRVLLCVKAGYILGHEVDLVYLTVHSETGRGCERLTKQAEENHTITYPVGRNKLARVIAIRPYYTYEWWDREWPASW